jgi:hypothetical protein
MTWTEFEQSLGQTQPPAEASLLLRALWHDAQGDWESAHQVAQDHEGERPYDRLHAYLHRKEGDAFNARYWYSRAQSEMPRQSLEAEWTELVREALAIG